MRRGRKSETTRRPSDDSSVSLINIAIDHPSSVSPPAGVVYSRPRAAFGRRTHDDNARRGKQLIYTRSSSREPQYSYCGWPEQNGTRRCLI